VTGEKKDFPLPKTTQKKISELGGELAEGEGVEGTEGDERGEGISLQQGGVAEKDHFVLAYGRKKKTVKMSGDRTAVSPKCVSRFFRLFGWVENTTND